MNIVKRYWNKIPFKQQLFIKFMLLAALCAGAVLIFFPQYTNIVYLTFLSMPTNSFIPIPHEPLMLYYAKIMHPLSVACWGSLGAAITAIIDYYIISKAFHYHKIAPVKKTKTFQLAVRYFNKVPFITIVIFSLGIVPVLSMTAIRIVAPAASYSLPKYVVGVFTGRWIRFFALALFGYVFKLPIWSIAVIGVVIFLATIWFSADGYKKGRVRKTNVKEESDTTRETLQVSP